MLLLTKNNAKGRCRACLCRLFKTKDSSYNVENIEASFQSSNFVEINSSKELKEMFENYLSINVEVDLNKHQLYPKYVCMDCLNHLQTFVAFRNKALDSAKKLYRIFNGNSNLPNLELNDEGLECGTAAEKHLNECVKEDDFNLFIKDSLMETEAFILDGDTNNGFSNTDPDPFQSTQKEDIKKPKSRRGKSKTYVFSSKTAIRKSKRGNSFEESESVKCSFESKLHSRKTAGRKKSDDDQPSDWLQDAEDDSSENEVLSKKNSKNEIEETNEKQNDRNKVNINDSYSIHEYSSKVLNSKSPTKGEFREDNCFSSLHRNIELDKRSLDIIKAEIDFDGDVSIDSVFNAKPNTFSKTITVEKKKRHYILNSGRKKGLANKYKCDQCQHKFGHKLTLEAHVRKVHEGQKKAFKCQLCDKAYSFIGGLSTHIRDVHERKQDSYDCSVTGCDKKYSNFITLQRHVRFKHLNMETPHQYVCEQCGATFKQSSNLRYHMKTRHPTEEDLRRKELLPKDRLECEECKKSFHSQYTLKYHKLRVHADEKKFECKICGRRVAKQFMLDSHMLVHSDQKMACKFCGREFVRKYQVEAHIRAVHQKLKPFQCTHCSESFASRKTLRHHIYIHTGEKPYVCDICGQAYRQPTCLKNHRKIHSKLTVNNSNTALAANRSFLSNFEQKSDALTNDEENLN